MRYASSSATLSASIGDSEILPVQPPTDYRPLIIGLSVTAAIGAAIILGGKK